MYILKQFFSILVNSGRIIVNYTYIHIIYIHMQTTDKVMNTAQCLLIIKMSIFIRERYPFTGILKENKQYM